jgi:hypothetical protein
MDTKNQMTNEQTFFIDGYWHDTLPEEINIDRFDKFDFKDCTQPEELWLDPEAEFDLAIIHKWLADKYLSKLFDDFEIKQCAMWSGVDEGSRTWHNDFEDGDSFNSNILIYLDDNTKQNGNNIQVRTGDYHFTLYPKRRDFVWLNQKKCFQHRAQHLSGTRRVLSFEYLVPALY